MMSYRDQREIWSRVESFTINRWILSNAMESKWFLVQWREITVTRVHQKSQTNCYKSLLFSVLPARTPTTCSSWQGPLSIRKPDKFSSAADGLARISSLGSRILLVEVPRSAIKFTRTVAVGRRESGILLRTHHSKYLNTTPCTRFTPMKKTRRLITTTKCRRKSWALPRWLPKVSPNSTKHTVITSTSK